LEAEFQNKFGKHEKFQLFAQIKKSERFQSANYFRKKTARNNLHSIICSLDADIQFSTPTICINQKFIYIL
jgi:hypothetical protein